MAKKAMKAEVMEASDNAILKLALKARGMLQIELADKMGVLQSSISGNMNRKRMGVDVFRSMLDAMEYDVVIVDRRTGEGKWRLSEGK